VQNDIRLSVISDPGDSEFGIGAAEDKKVFCD